METLDLKFDFLHNKIIDDSPPPLFQFASAKVAKCFWYAEKFVKGDFFGKRVTRIQEKIYGLLLPDTVKDEVALTVKIIADQLISLNSVLGNIFSNNPKNYFFFAG